MNVLKVKIVLEEEMLGMGSSDPDLHETYIASKAPDAPTREEEIEALGVDEVVAKGKTVFPRDDDGCPILWDYQIKGMFKDSCGMLSRAAGTKSSQLKAYKKIIDGLIFPKPRRIRLVLPKGASIGECQRPLRAQTAQGERVALAHSETVPAGTKIEFEVAYLPLKESKVGLDEVIKEWLEYGSLRGLGQWRNSGKGRYSVEITHVS